MSSYVTKEHADRAAEQIGARTIVDGDRLVFKVCNANLGSTLIERIDDQIFVSRHAVEGIIGIKLQ